ncbi:MAG TPA: dihydrolipoamide acetyltransferase family protein [Trebonia sp.]
MPDFLLPDLGEGLDEAEVIAWHVKPGDRVTVDQVIVEVETAKAVVEVPVPYEGVVSVLHAAPGGTISVGQPLITVTADEPATRERAAGQPTANNRALEWASTGEPTANQPATGQRASDEPTGGDPAPGLREPGAITADANSEEASGSVLIGYGTTAAAPARSRRGRRRNPGSAPLPAAPPARPAGPEPPAPSGRVAVISPVVRKEARDAGLELASLTGTGPAGVITRPDVRRAIAERAARSRPLATPDADTADADTAANAAASGTAATGTRVSGAGTTASAASGTGATGPGTRRIPLRGARRAAAEKLSRSRREIPEATVWVDVDATALVETRRALNAADRARPVSLLALLARFTVLGLRRYPELNARIEQDEIVIPEGVNLGFAAQTEHGLVVPVVADAHRLTTRDLSARLAECTTAARERRLAPADLSGGTFTVNNYGVFGVDGSAAIINHPEVAILGMGRVIDRPWVVDGQLAVRKVTELTLAFDHRACDGGTAGGFLRYVADCIESPATALGDM